MKDEMIRQKIHRAVDVHGASLREDPYLAQRILASSDRKEAPRMKKLSTGAIIAIVLMLLSVTALAVGLTAEELWRQSQRKMSTTGYVNMISDDAQAEITLDEALAIARKAIQDKYATPDAELDAMGVYPTYLARGWDGKTDEYPSEWDIHYSSRTNVDLDLDTLDYGPTGEYRVYINAETKEVTYCNWYCSDFWPFAQRLWDAGKYDIVYNYYQKPDFYTLPAEVQAYWTELLSGKGYEVIRAEDKYFRLLRSLTLSDLEFGPLTNIVPNDDPQVAAAWQALEDRWGYDTTLMQKYAYVASKPGLETGTEDVCLFYSYELEFSMLDAGAIPHGCNLLFSHVNDLGKFMVSFTPGTTEVVSAVRILPSEQARKTPQTEGDRYQREDWYPEDLIAFDADYQILERGVKRMQAAGLENNDIFVNVQAYVNPLTHYVPDPFFDNPNIPAPEDVAEWYAESSEWDALIVEPDMTYQECAAKYGADRRFWPLEVQYEILRDTNRQITLPQEGEMSYEEALAYAIDAIIKQEGQEAIDKLGNYVVGCNYTRYIGAHYNENTMWEFYIADKQDWTMGWRVLFVDKNWQDFGERHVEVNDIFDEGLG